MKNILAVMGSPRCNGNTNHLINKIASKAPEGYNVDIIKIKDFKINGCKGCSCCQNDFEKYECTQSDDTNMLLKKIIEADAVLYGTPLYGHNYSGQLKIFLDRHIPLFKFVDGANKSVNDMKILSIIKNKPVCLIVSCRGPEKYNTEIIKMLFDKFCESSLSHCIGKYTFSFCEPEINKNRYNDDKINKIWESIIQNT